MYVNSATIVGFAGADPEQRQAKSNGAKFAVFSVAAQRSWKNAQDEWSSKTKWHRICIFRPRLAEYVLQSIKKGSHVLVEGSLISSTYEKANGKGKKATTAKITSWSIRADVVRRLDRGEPEPEAITPNPAASEEAPETTEHARFLRGSRRGLGDRRGLFLCWPRLRPIRRNLPQNRRKTSAFVHSTWSAFPTTRAKDSDLLEEREGTIPETPGVVPRPE
jgi:single-strand DNA-binding protein